MKILDGQKGKRCTEKAYEAYTHKRCPSCSHVKAVHLFYKRNTRTARGWAWDSKCIECRRKDCRLYGIRSRAKRNARLRQWRKRNPAAVKRMDHKQWLRRTYGLSVADVEAMREKQAGCCAICHKPSRRLFVDHCHATGKVRALLCQTCNTFLGWYENKADIITVFQQYLEAHW